MTDVVAGRFALCDPIARGGSGTVWRAYDRKLEQFCAAKVLRRRDAGDLLRFVREQSVRMSHEHVLTPYSWAAEDAYVVIASELVDGGSLTTLVADWGPLAESTVAALLDQLLLALEQVHGTGLVHRDVKPANLLLRATGTGPIQVLLGDFGLAIGEGDAHLTQTGTVVGTPGYLAPELLRGDVHPVPRHDLYAAGRVAAALAAGREPTRLGEPTDLSGFTTPALRDLVADLCALDAEDRPPTAAAARHRLHDALAGRPYDRTPRSRSGGVIDVMHQLPPLSETAIAEGRGTGGAVPAAADGETGAMAAGPSHARLAGAPTIDPPTRRPSTPPFTAVADRLPPATAGRGQGHGQGHGSGRGPGRGAGRGAVVAAGGLLVAALAAVPLTLALSGDGDSTGVTPRPSTTPARTTGGTYTAPAVVAGQECDLTAAGDVRRAAGGGEVRCIGLADGRYVWRR